jgi:hypothetical protein
LDSGTLQRENTSGYRVNKSNSSRFGGGKQGLYNLSGRVLYTSVSGVAKSCSFQIQTWNATWNWDNSIGMWTGPLDVNGLTVDPQCSALSATGFLPDPSLSSLSSGGSYYNRALASGDVVLLGVFGYYRPYAWFSGGTLTWSSSELGNSGGTTEFFAEKHYSGAIQSISPFHWTPMVSAPLK